MFTTDSWLIIWTLYVSFLSKKLTAPGWCRRRADIHAPSAQCAVAWSGRTIVRQIAGVIQSVVFNRPQHSACSSRIRWRNRRRSGRTAGGGGGCGRDADSSLIFSKRRNGLRTRTFPLQLLHGSIVQFFRQPDFVEQKIRGIDRLLSSASATSRTRHTSATVIDLCAQASAVTNSKQTKNHNLAITACSLFYFVTRPLLWKRAGLRDSSCGRFNRVLNRQVGPRRDREPWYTQTVSQVAQLNREAENSLKDKKPDQAAAAIEKAEPLVTRLLNVSHPSLEAAQAASDLDDLYGRMLLSNRHYGWARLQFQKNLSRWKHWTPQTPETERRYKQALAEIAECDRHIEE